MKKGDTVPLHNPQTLQKLLVSQESQAYVMAFLSFFALAFFTIFAIRPTLISFFNLQKQIEDANSMNEKLTSKIGSLLIAQKTYQDYQSEIALLDKALPKDPQFAQFIQKLETIVIDKGSSTTAFSTEEVTLLNKNKPAQSAENSLSQIAVPAESVRFSMSLSSNYKNNESVLATVLGLKRIVSLSNLSFSAGDTESDQKEIETILNAEAYYLP